MPTSRLTDWGLSLAFVVQRSGKVRGNRVLKKTRHRKMAMGKMSTSKPLSCAASFTCPSFTCHPRAGWGRYACVGRGFRRWKMRMEKASTFTPPSVISAGKLKPSCQFSDHAQTRRQTTWAIANDPPLYAHVPLRALQSHTPGRPPGPPVKTEDCARRFRGCSEIGLQAGLAARGEGALCEGARGRTAARPAFRNRGHPSKHTD